MVLCRREIQVSVLGGAQTSDIPITGTYTVAGAGNTIAITPSGQPTLTARMYIASSGLLRLISIDATDFAGMAWKQF